jgi:4-hydroxy-tetrahydrodipicolinate synthase
MKSRPHSSSTYDTCSKSRVVSLIPTMLWNARASLPTVANVAPRPVAELYDAFVAGDHERARELHYDLSPLVELAFLETNPVPGKWAMKELGVLESDHVRPPLAQMSDISRDRARLLLASAALPS